jgi:hypothetical protein
LIIFFRKKTKQNRNCQCFGLFGSNRKKKKFIFCGIFVELFVFVINFPVCIRQLVNFSSLVKTLFKHESPVLR